MYSFHFSTPASTGIVSLVSLSLLSYERYTTVLHSSQVDVSDFRKAWLFVGGSWFYSLFWTLPPLLGWSSYGPEGPGTTCSVQWHLRSPSSILYVLCLFIFCLLLPLLLMLYSYGRILMAIRRVSSEIHEEFHHIFWDDHSRQRENHATTYSATMSFLVVYLCVSKS